MCIRDSQSTSANNYLLDKLQAARASREIARTSGTNAKLDRAWKRWELFLVNIELEHDEFLDNLSPANRVRILGAFAQAVREREFSSAGKADLQSSTCKETVDKVAEAFRANNRSDPRYGPYDKEDDNLRLQYRGYANKDPPTKQQKALTPSFYRQLFHRSTSHRTIALSLLCISAFFWACRSCEYSKAPSERKTKLCRVKNIRFFSGTRELSHSDPNLINAERVTWTFEDQKNDEKNVTIPQERPLDEPRPIPCPNRSTHPVLSGHIRRIIHLHLFLRGLSLIHI